jgi:hypothetical protein
VTTESIASTDTTSTVECPSTAYLVPPVGRTGARWSAACSLQSPSEKVGFNGEALGRSTMAVGGTSVTVEHTRFVLTFKGSQSGTNPTDFWVVPSTGLIVREKEEVGVTSGGVTYSENMEATLSRLTPDR